MNTHLTAATVCIAALAGCATAPYSFQGITADGAAISGDVAAARLGQAARIEGRYAKAQENRSCAGLITARKGNTQSGHLACLGIGGGAIKITNPGAHGFGSGKIGGRDYHFSVTAK